ncbi:hypothetical protein [Nitratireductor thuwali]|uniref:DUF4145 domain-containing protein n=1 Tax=Nitratireductor thuwali TaxID=2267699 RepID=A0ABY5MNF3_9HYPH|nr:hypothetical protein NTH_04023 [Nitratireductor thuwali]
MASIPGHCHHCGCIFDGRGGIHIENSSNITVSGSRMTCPNCGKMANLVDGTFNERAGRLELVSGPPITRDILSHLQHLVAAAEAGEITKEELATRAAELHEGVGSAIAYLVSRYPKTLLFVVSLVMMLKACNPQVKLDLNELVDQVVQKTRQTEGLHPALDAEGQDVKQHKTSSDSKPAENGPANKQDRISHNKPPSARRRVVNRGRRMELKRRRLQFPRWPRGR